jgi:hypothetical protein
VLGKSKALESLTKNMVCKPSTVSGISTEEPFIAPNKKGHSSSIAFKDQLAFSIQHSALKEGHSSGTKILNTQPGT